MCRMSFNVDHSQALNEKDSQRQIKATRKPMRILFVPTTHSSAMRNVLGPNVPLLVLSALLAWLGCAPHPNLETKRNSSAFSLLR